MMLPKNCSLRKASIQTRGNKMGAWAGDSPRPAALKATRNGLRGELFNHD